MRLTEQVLHRPTPRAAPGLWLAAFVLTVVTAGYQRMTGPTRPERGRLELGGQSLRYRLPRSGTTPVSQRIEVPAPGTETSATLWFRRYPSDDPFTSREMREDGAVRVGELPAQPAAGKVEYYIEVRAGDRAARIPEGAENIILRFKDPVPLQVLVVHIAFMFAAMLVGIRAAFAALGGGPLRRLTWITVGGLTAGGLILGPVVQWYAFGAFWTGWPLGSDATDNKTLVMWLAWLLAALLVGRLRRDRSWVSRGAVLLAAAVMIAVYLVPHSLGGSQLDYDAVEQGIDARDAIRTGGDPG